MRLPVIIFILLHYCVGIHAQPGTQLSSQIVLFPAGLNFVPLKANLYEPRIGVFLFSDGSRMRVDIGNSVEVLAWETGQMRITTGIDFMAYAYTTGAKGLRLQVDAMDGIFGGHLTISEGPDQQHLIMRLRILHHSAHFADGHYIETNPWANDSAPVPYTRDFGELILMHTFRKTSYLMRCYGGMSYATLVRPSEVRRIEYLTGFETVSEHLLGPILDNPANIYIAYNISLTGTPAYVATNQIQIGSKLGQWLGKGVTIYLSYYSGRHMFREYLLAHLSTFGFGFTVDF